MIVYCEWKGNTGRESNKEGVGRGDAHLSSRTPLCTEMKPKEVFKGLRAHTFFIFLKRCLYFYFIIIIIIFRSSIEFNNSPKPWICEPGTR